MAFAGTADVNVILWQNPYGQSQKVAIGSQAGNSIGTDDAITILNQVEARLYSMLAPYLSIPPYLGTSTTDTHPMIVEMEAKMAAARIIRSVIQRTSDGKPDPYADYLEKDVLGMYGSIRSRDFILMGSNGAVVAYAGAIYSGFPSSSQPQSGDVFQVKTVTDNDLTLSKEGFRIVPGAGGTGTQ